MSKLYLKYLIRMTSHMIQADLHLQGHCVCDLIFYCERSLNFRYFGCTQDTHYLKPLQPQLQCALNQDTRLQMSAWTVPAVCCDRVGVMHKEVFFLRTFAVYFLVKFPDLPETRLLLLLKRHLPAMILCIISSRYMYVHAP